MSGSSFLDSDLFVTLAFSLCSPSPFLSLLTLHLSSSLISATLTHLFLFVTSPAIDSCVVFLPAPLLIIFQNTSLLFVFTFQASALTSTDTEPRKRGGERARLRGVTTNKQTESESASAPAYCRARLLARIASEAVASAFRVEVAESDPESAGCFRFLMCCCGGGGGRGGGGRYCEVSVVCMISRSASES